MLIIYLFMLIMYLLVYSFMLIAANMATTEQSGEWCTEELKLRGQQMLLVD